MAESKPRKHPRMDVYIPYGRIVEFRKWWQSHPHIVWKARGAGWNGHYGSSYHAKKHWVYMEDPGMMAFIKLAWCVGPPRD